MALSSEVRTLSARMERQAELMAGQARAARSKHGKHGCKRRATHDPTGLHVIQLQLRCGIIHYPRNDAHVESEQKTAQRNDERDEQRMELHGKRLLSVRLSHFEVIEFSRQLPTRQVLAGQADKGSGETPMVTVVIRKNRSIEIDTNLVVHPVIC